MRRAFNKTMAIINTILATTGGVDPKTGEKRDPVKDRFVEGDQFYKGLTHKRVNGKWRVKN